MKKAGLVLGLVVGLLLVASAALLAYASVNTSHSGDLFALAAVTAIAGGILIGEIKREWK